MGSRTWFRFLTSFGEPLLDVANMPAVHSLRGAAVLMLLILTVCAKKDVSLMHNQTAR